MQRPSVQQFPVVEEVGHGRNVVCAMVQVGEVLCVRELLRGASIMCRILATREVLYSYLRNSRSDV